MHLPSTSSPPSCDINKKQAVPWLIQQESSVSLSVLDQQKYSNKHSPAPLALRSSFMGPQAEGFVSHTSINHKAQDIMTAGGQFHSSNVLTYISYCRAVTWAHLTICSLPHSPLVTPGKPLRDNTQQNELKSYPAHESMFGTNK